MDNSLKSLDGMFYTYFMKSGSSDATEFERLLQNQFKDPSLVLDVREEWSAIRENHREQIKAGLAEFAAKAKTDISDSNPNNVNSRLVSSISHCLSKGGFVASTKLPRIGFDIEENSRVKDQILLRMFTQDEIDQCPEPYALWCAKEALYKVLQGPDQPGVLSELPVLEWEKASSEYPIYKISFKDKNLNEKKYSSLVGYCWIGSKNSLCVWGDSI